MDAYLAIVSKREVRDYLARPLEPEIERRILEAGRIAGSAKNRQPWTFVVVRDDKAVEAVAASVYEPQNVSGAALIVAIHMDGGAGIDAGRAAQNMMLAAWALGVGSCPNGISDKIGVNRALGLAEEDRVAAVLSFGYPAKEMPRRTPEEWIESARRKPYGDVVREV